MRFRQGRQPRETLAGVSAEEKTPAGSCHARREGRFELCGGTAFAMSEVNYAK